MARKTVRRERKDKKTEKAVVKSAAEQGAGGPETKLIEAGPARTPTRKQPPDLSWQAKGIRPGSDVVEVELKDVDAGDTTFQCRVTTRNLKTLMDSIRMEGQLEPVRLRGKAPYQIVSGFSRIEAIRQLRGDRVKAIVMADITSDEAFRLSYIENAKRQSLTPMDKAYVVGRLEAAGKSQADIAQEMGLSEKQVSNLKKALTFPKEVQDAISRGTLSLKHGLVLEATGRGRKINAVDWIKRIKAEGLSVEGLKKVLTREAPKRGRKRRFLKTSRRKIESPRFALDLDQATEAELTDLKRSLQDALKAIG